ncbi:MAG: alkaline phosphatase family protein, partial [Acidobacteriaceae bacterium]|nr:alkaline phosphatase family protein [Acidobacteriaceae bacterium]
SFFTLLLGLIGSFFSILIWPVRAAWTALRYRKILRRARIRKLIFIGFDGLDARLTEKWMAERKLPNLSRLREVGGYRRLRTTFPALSPVAWSTFATGVNPAKHNIFDFLSRSARSYLPELGPAKVEPPMRRWQIGKLRIPLSRPVLQNRRKSESFWTILGRYQIRSTILRVPVSFPPERFNGKQLAAMCTPDLKGTQGSFFLFTTRQSNGELEGGRRYPLTRSGDSLTGWIDGPEDPLGAEKSIMRIPFEIYCGAQDEAFLRVQRQSIRLRKGQYSPWVKLKFCGKLGVTVTGVARFLVTETGDEFTLYASPLEIDPERPALPISHPRLYAVYLAKLMGSFATLGLAEDTWACNEGAISEQEFLDQAYLIFDERERMFLNALAKTRKGVVGCVFDTSDRIQHIFFRHLGAANADSPFSRTIEHIYQRMDDVVGKALRYVDGETLLLVLSDHGFSTFRRGVNLNAWLRDNGYLRLRPDGNGGGKYFEGVDWERTSAYALGLGGLYFNVRGREPQGIVERGNAARELKRDLIGKLTGLRDAELEKTAIRDVYDAEAIYQGPYLGNSPDLIVGYDEGYRTAWGAALGEVSGLVFEDNNKPWSGDHSVDPALVPGVLFANRAIQAENPGIEDLAPTCLEMFGIDRPRWMDGKPVFTAC